MPRAKITKRLCDRTDTKPGTTWDAEIRGFGFRVSTSGKRDFILDYTNKHGQRRRYSFAKYPGTTPDAARERALQLRAAVDAGADPVADKDQMRSGMTVAEFAKVYLVYVRDAKGNKPRSVAADEQRLRTHILPVIGSKPMDAVSQEDVLRLKRAMADKPTTFNRVLSLLHSMFEQAIRTKAIMGENPTKGVKQNREVARQRYLSPNEFRRLSDALNYFEALHDDPKGVKPVSREAITAIRLLILTGCRRGEILGLRWENVDLHNGVLNLPDSKTGQKQVVLNSGALGILAGLRRNPSGYVIPGRDDGMPLENLKKPWGKILKHAGIEGLTIHDLRHSFAAVGAGASLGLPILARLLGHRNTSTTERYSHLADNPLKAATEAIGKAMQEMMTGQTAEVVDLTAKAVSGAVAADGGGEP